MPENIQQQVDQLKELFAKLYQEGEYEKALNIAKQLHDLARERLGEQHQEFANSLNNLALVYQEIGNFNEAEKLYGQLLEIIRANQGEENRYFASILGNFASLYQVTGQLDQAETLLRQALAIKSRTLGEGTPSFANSLNNLAQVVQVKGDYKEAEQLHLQAMRIRYETLGSESREFAQSSNNVGLIYLELGDYEHAEPFLRQAFMIRYKVLGANHPDFANSLTNMASLYHRQGNYKLAHEFYVKAIESQIEIFGYGRPDLGILLDNFAGLCQEVGNYDEARKLYLKAQDILRATVGEEHPDYAINLHNLASLYRESGSYDEAESCYQKALQITKDKTGEENMGYSRLLHGLAEVYAATDRLTKAFSEMSKALAIEDRNIGVVSSLSSESRRMAYLTPLQSQLEIFLSLILEHFSDSPEAVSAGLDCVLRRKAMGAEAGAIQRDAVQQGVDLELHSMWEELVSLRNRIAQETLAGNGSDDALVHDLQVNSWKGRKDYLEAELARRTPEMRLDQKLRSADRESVAGALPEGTVLVEFVRMDVYAFKAVHARDESNWKAAHYVVFVLPAGESNKFQMIDLGEAEPIDQMIAAFRSSITGEGESRGKRDLVAWQGKRGSTASDSHGLALRVALFDPLLPAIGDRKRLLLAPDGDLTRLPFEVLPSDDRRLLVDDYQISYLSAGRDVLRFGVASSRQPAEPLVVADPNFDLSSDESETNPTSGVVGATENGRVSRELDSSNLHFSPLPGTRAEGMRIAKMLKVQPWLADNGLEARLKTCHSPRILHLATHGFFLPNLERDPKEKLRDLNATGRLGRLSGPQMENPLLRSGLALAGANTWLKNGQTPAEAEDGILTAEDVTGLDLLATELVVLSACDTGLGEVRAGEGVFGLRRSFVLAGTKTLVMSLWKVPDAQTQELMEGFYARILAGEPRAEALRQSQLEMKKKYPHPVNWGAFICQGDPGPLH
ncbi:MAG: CHAT domain-containing tetratricopeptide repeat protein [Pyrinomonadaceae bacterium]